MVTQKLVELLSPVRIRIGTHEKINNMGIEDIHKPKSIEDKEALTEEETKAFLEKNGVKPLTTLRDWRPYQTILYVIEEDIRRTQFREKGTPAELEPIIARIDSPVKIIVGNDDPKTGSKFLDIENWGGQVAYYTMGKDNTPILCKLSNKTKHYQVRADNLFFAADHLFPKAIEKTE